MEVSAPQVDEQTLEQIEFATLAPILETFPHEKFDELCRIMDLKQAELRQAELVVPRLDLHTAITGQACDAEAASKARQAYEAGKVIVENIQRELGAFRALRPPVKTSSSSTQNSPSAPRKKSQGGNVNIHPQRDVWTVEVDTADDGRGSLLWRFLLHR